VSWLPAEGVLAACLTKTAVTTRVKHTFSTFFLPGGL